MHREIWLCVVVLLAACGEDTPVAPADPVGAPEAAPLPPMARVVAVSGDVRVRRAGSAGWVAASAGDALLPGDAVQTLGDSRAAVRFGEGGVTSQLEPGTTIRMPARDEHVTRLTHLAGRLIARVTPGQEGSHLEVELPPGTLVLAATPGATGEQVEARIDVSDTQTNIAMVRGAGRLRRPHGDVLEVPSERFVTVAPSGEVLARGWSGRGALALEPAAAASVRTRSEVTFRWSEVGGASGYVLRIVGPDGAARELPMAETVARVALQAGAHRWTVSATIDGEPTQPSDERAFTVDLDRVAPTLELRTPTPGQRIAGAVLMVDGRTEPGARLDVDGDPVAVAPDGTFHATRSIARGLAQVIFRVHDDLGNVRVVSRTVVRQ